MEKHIAKGLLPLVNDVDHYSLLQGFIDYRINVLRGFLETTRDHYRLTELQGAIAELRKMQMLKEDAHQGAK